MLDLTAEARVKRAEAITREQRADPGLAAGGSVLVWDDPGGTEVCYADDYRDLRFELERLQRAVMGEEQRR